MLNDKENTAVYLMHVYTRACSIVSNSGKDMDELKKTGEIKLETDEERELGLHLLQFADAMDNTCRYILPHFMCKYLYDLSKSLLVSTQIPRQVVSAEETRTSTSTSRFLLCKATEVVMRKCFYLLGITTTSDL